MEVIVPTQSKESVSEGEPDSNPPPPPTRESSMNDRDPDITLKLEVEMGQDRLRQRDREIGILLRMLKQERKRADRAEVALAASGAIVRSVSPASPDRLSPLRLAKIAVPSDVSISSTVAAADLDGILSPQGVVVEMNTDGGRGGGEKRRGLVDANGSSRTVSVTYGSSHDSEEWRAALKEGENGMRNLVG